MESYEAIYSDIGVFNSALIGKFVFAGEYIFSQDGFGSSSEEYILMDRMYDDYEDVAAAISNYIAISKTVMTKEYGSIDLSYKYN